MQTHSEEEKYKCGKCDLHLSRSSHLKKHQEKVHLKTKTTLNQSPSYFPDTQFLFLTYLAKTVRNVSFMKKLAKRPFNNVSHDEVLKLKKKIETLFMTYPRVPMSL